MKIIAHRVNDVLDAKKALDSGADFVEVDVAKRLLLPKFTIQHNSIKGKLGIGPIFASMLIPSFQKKLFLDLKHTNISFRFAAKLSQLLKTFKVKPMRVCGLEWNVISQICENNNLLPFYTIRTERGVKKIKEALHRLKKPSGFSVHFTQINETLVKELKAHGSEIWVHTINEVNIAKNMQNLGVDGIITDNYKLMIEELGIKKEVKKAKSRFNIPGLKFKTNFR